MRCGVACISVKHFLNFLHESRVHFAFPEVVKVDQGKNMIREKRVAYVCVMKALDLNLVYRICDF